MRLLSVVSGFIFLLMCDSIFANPPKSLAGCIDCFNFVAPSVLGAENINPAEIGLIVYDADVDQFRGYSQSTGWQQLTNKEAIHSISSATTLDLADSVVFASASAGAFTVSLPTATNCEGKVFHIKKTDSTFAAVTIDGNSSETIDGSATKTLNTRDESLRIISDGSNWKVLSRHIPSEWESFTPTGSWTTNATYAGRKRRVGQNLEAWITITMSGTNTQGQLTVTLPNSLQMDTSALISTTASSTMIGSVAYRDSAGSGTGDIMGFLRYDSSTVLSPVVMLTESAQTHSTRVINSSSNVPKTVANNDIVKIYFSVPISGWSGF